MFNFKSPVPCPECDDMVTTMYPYRGHKACKKCVEEDEAYDEEDGEIEPRHSSKPKNQKLD